MAITGVPTFSDGEIPSASKLNLLGSSITTKFAGAIGPADMTWDLVCQGNVDMDNTHSVTNMRKFWGMYNASEYSTDSEIVDVVAAVNTAGGGIIHLEPNTTYTIASGVEITSSNIAIRGSGPSSILKLGGSASDGFMFRTAAGTSNISFSDLTIDGTSVASQKGLIFRDTNDIEINHVTIKNCAAHAVEFTHSGTAGNPCTDVRMHNVKISGGASGGAHIVSDDLDGATFTQIVSESALATAINLSADAINTKMRDISLADVQITTVTGSGIHIQGNSTANNDWSRIALSNCHVSGATANGFNIGTLGKELKYITLTGCTAHDAAVDGFNVEATTGLISGCQAYSPGTGDGLNLLGSTDVIVTGCNFIDAANGFGVVAGNTITCIITNCNVQGSSETNKGIDKDGTTTTLLTGNNLGDHGPSVGAIVTNTTTYTETSTTDMGFSYTIPANTMHIGSVMRVVLHGDFTETGAATTGGMALLVGGDSAGGLSGLDATTDFGIVWETTVVAMTGAGTLGHAMATGDTLLANSSGDYTLTVDWTTDTAITFTGTAGSGDTIRVLRVSIELLGAPENAQV